MIKISFRELFCIEQFGGVYMEKFIYMIYFNTIVYFQYRNGIIWIVGLSNNNPELKKKSLITP